MWLSQNAKIWFLKVQDIITSAIKVDHVVCAVPLLFKHTSYKFVRDDCSKINKIMGVYKMNKINAFKAPWIKAIRIIFMASSNLTW